VVAKHQWIDDIQPAIYGEIPQNTPENVKTAPQLPAAPFSIV
jgi:hypothetical protein